MGAARALAQATAPLTPADRKRVLVGIVRELERRRPPSDLHPKQRRAFASEATELLYGGAAGGGKSHLMRRAAIAWCTWVRGLQVYIFRRTFPDLFKNHMEGPSGFPVLLSDAILAGEARIVWGKNQIRFRNGPKGTETGGSVIHLCHCQLEKDVYDYQGAEIHVLLIDELTQWTRKMYAFLRSRVRLGGLKVARWLKHVFPRILCSANPGGIGHNWVKAAWIDLAPEGAVTQMPNKEGGMRRQFIRALLEDNPTMAENDPTYEGKLEGMGDPELVRAMRWSDWDIVAGGFFDDLWRRDVHAIAPFTIPGSWTVDRSFDWGSSHPFSVGWWAESDGTEAPNGKVYPRGTLFRINEWYGWNGTPNEGLKMSARDIALGILERERAMGLVVNPGPADSAIYAVENEMCIAADMEKAGVTWLEADKSPGSRATRWQKLRDRLQAAATKPMEMPGLFVFNHCTQFIRCVPVLPRDEKKRDDIDTKAEDHIADETGYRLLAPRAAGAPRMGRFKVR
jgi:Terminase large subunit, T4likevirus-type, N-terminal